MRWTGRGRRWGEGLGLVGSAAFTGLIFGLAPLLALLWLLDGVPVGPGWTPRLEVEQVPAAPVHLALAPAQDGDQGAGEDGLERAPLAAGPEADPSSAGTGGDGAEEGGDGGAPDRDRRAQADLGVDRAEGLAAGARLARGARRPGAEAAARLALRQREGVIRRRGRRVPCPDQHPDVQQTGAQSWTVNRNLVEYYTANFKRFNSLGWSGPYDHDAVKGWKIGGFGCTSPLHHAGLRRGDVILSINDKKTRTWMQIFGAYMRLKRKDHFEVVLIRRGTRKTLHYTLVDGGPPTVG